MILMHVHEVLKTPTGHTVRFEGDFTVVTLLGQLTVPDAELLSAAYDQELQRHRYLLLLVDLAGSSGASSEARRTLVMWAKPHGTVISAAAYGGSVFVRSFMKLMNGAVRMLSGKQPALEFFSTEAEARHFLTKERERLQQLVQARNSSGDRLQTPR